MPFAVEICNAVLDVWEPTPDHKAIINLPSTVEMATPNIYADQIEYCCENLKYRNSIYVQPACTQRPRHSRSGNRAGYAGRG